MVDEEMVGDGGACPPYNARGLCIVFAASQHDHWVILSQTVMS